MSFPHQSSNVLLLAAFLVLGATAVIPSAAAEKAPVYKCFIEQVARGGEPYERIEGSDTYYRHDYQNCEIVSGADCQADGPQTDSRCPVCVLKYYEYHYVAQSQGEDGWQDSSSEEHGGVCV